MARPVWEIEKDTAHGTSFRLFVGPPGIPGSVHVDGLSRQQAEALGVALTQLEKKVAFRALENVREALGIPQH